MNTTIRRATTCFICKDNKVLLALVKYPDMTVWMGIGGWAEIGESAEDAVIREVFEETYIEIQKSDIKKVLEFPDGNHLHVFVATNWSGELKIKELSLKELRWFSFDEIPWEQTFPGTKKWLPKILNQL